MNVNMATSVTMKFGSGLIQKTVVTATRSLCPFLSALKQVCAASGDRIETNP